MTTHPYCVTLCCNIVTVTIFYEDKYRSVEFTTISISTFMVENYIAPNILIFIHFHNIYIEAYIFFCLLKYPYNISYKCMCIICVTRGKQHQATIFNRLTTTMNVYALWETNHLSSNGCHHKAFENLFRTCESLRHFFKDDRKKIYTHLCVIR